MMIQLVSATLFFALFVALPASGRSLNAQHLIGGLSALPESEAEARAILQDAADCGIQGEVFHVTGQVDQTDTFQPGAYFLIRHVDLNSPCPSRRWLFLFNPDLREGLLEKAATGEQIVLHFTNKAQLEHRQAKIDAIAVPPGNSTALSLFNGFVDTSKPLLIVTPTMTHSVYKHERQHFEDYTKSLPAKLVAEMNKHNFPSEAQYIMLHYVMESRAYGCQLEFLRTSNLSIECSYDEDGDLASFDGPKLRAVQAEQLLESFQRDYTDVIAGGLDNLREANPGDYREFVAFLRKHMRAEDIAALNLDKALPDLLRTDCDDALSAP